jgi:hypothetical protein
VLYFDVAQQSPTLCGENEAFSAECLCTHCAIGNSLGTDGEAFQITMLETTAKKLPNFML